jgi:hypothetical protein
VLFYLVALGFGVPLAHVALDRIAVIERPHIAVLWMFPALAAGIWLMKSAAMLSPVRLAFPLVVGLTLWAMMRLGRARKGGIDLGAGGPVWRHFLFPLAPLLAVLIVVPIWEAGGSFVGHWVNFSITVPLSLGLWLWCLWSAARTPASPYRPERAAAFQSMR